MHGQSYGIIECNEDSALTQILLCIIIKSRVFSSETGSDSLWQRPPHIRANLQHENCTPGTIERTQPRIQTLLTHICVNSSLLTKHVQKNTHQPWPQLDVSFDWIQLSHLLDSFTPTISPSTNRECRKHWIQSHQPAVIHFDEKYLLFSIF